MEISGLLRHQIIESLTVAATEDAVDTAIARWEQMTTQIIAIVGVGFNSLYAHSIFRSQPEYPWLADSEASLSADKRFAALRNSLERQPPAIAIEAHNRLLCTFTDILAALIDETLSVLKRAADATNRMLHALADLDVKLAVDD